MSENLSNCPPNFEAGRLMKLFWRNHSRWKVCPGTKLEWAGFLYLFEKKALNAPRRHSWEAKYFGEGKKKMFEGQKKILISAVIAAKG